MKLVIDTQNGQTLTLVRDGDDVTIRIAKDGHNRAIAKLTGNDASAIAEFLIWDEGEWTEDRELTE